jgi:endonuclease YncB( thermonuclease family)
MKRSKTIMVAAVAGCITLASASWANTFSAKVTSVRDGDSLVVSHKGRSVDLDLAGVHAPSARSEHGAQARDLLIQLAKKKKAEVTVVRTHFGEGDVTVANVTVDGQDLATALIKAGLARPTSEATKEQLAAADQAKAAQAGIWANTGTTSSTGTGR